MVRIAKIFLAVTFLILSINPAYAAHPLSTDDTGTQGKGKFQLEVNSEYGWEKEDGVKEKAGQITAALSYGLIENVDVVLGVPYLFVKTEDAAAGFKNSESGFSDVTLELKWRFYEKDGFSLAFKPGISFATGDDEKGLGTGKTGYSGFLIMTQELKPFAVHVNLGYIHNENKAEERKDIWHASVAGEYEATKNVKIAGNIGTEKNADPDSGTNPAFAIAGVIYQVTENFSFDIGYKYGLNKPETNNTILAGIAIKF
jgi:opacity protein-like surface antigen